METPCIATVRRPLTLVPLPPPFSRDEWAQWQRIAHAEARRRLFRRLAAEEIAERALFELVQLHLLGRPPVVSTAWLRGVVRNLAARWLASSDAHCQSLGGEEPLAATPSSMRCSIADGADEWHRRIQALQPDLERVLTSRQRHVLGAVRAGQGLRAVARACGMSPRDLRDTMRSIAAKARALLGAAADAPQLPA